MSKRCAVIVILLFIALPTVIYGRWIKDKVYLQTEAVGKVEFSHYEHMAMESIGKNCPTCHNDAYHIVVDKNPVFSMTDMEEGKACGVCHNGKKAFAVTGDCTTCHAGDVEINYGTAEKVVFSHDVHTEMFGCDECHPDLFVPERNNNQVGMARMEEGESCGACHDGDTAFGVQTDCGSCHPGAEDIAMNSTVGAVVFSHDIHAGMFGCDECHPDVFQPKANSNQVGMKKMAAGESCGTCHDGDSAFAVTGDCVSCHSNAADLEIQADNISPIPFSHTVHTEMFGCGECHPDIFAAKANSNQVGMAKMEEGESCGACHDGDTAFGVADSCSSCHSGKVNFTKDIAIGSSVGPVSFAHTVHTEMFGCDECHPDLFKAKTNSTKVGMAKMEAGESCGACHDDDTVFGVTGDCTACHTKAVDLAISTQNVGPVSFSHSIHSEMLGCDECHPDLFVPQLNSTKVGMAKMEEGESCGACHDGDTAFNVNGDCASCHDKAVEVSIKANNVQPVPFSHSAHTEMFGCEECHPDIFKPMANSNQVGMLRMESGESCGACHDGDTAFSVKQDCNTCHTAGISYKKDVDIRSTIWSIIFSHEVHTENYSCDECHPSIFKARANSTKVGMKKMEAGESCGACHDGDTAFSVAGDCITCHNRSLPSDIKAKGVGTVPFSHAYHTRELGCDECHPDLFKTEANANQVGMAKMEEGESCGACHDGDNAFGVKGDCTTCHVGAVDVAMQTKDVGTVPFSHAVHSEMFACSECHPETFVAKANSTKVGMKRMEQGESCGACHDGDTAFGVKGDCTTCHIKAVDVPIKTRTVGDATFSHAVHAEMYACNECHPKIFRAKANSNIVGMKGMEQGASCGACHDGGTAFGVTENCASCHAGDVKFTSFGTIVFSHGLHNDMFSCNECHPEIYTARQGANKATMDDMEFGKSCGACHNGNAAFDISNCNPCHPR